MVEHHDLPDPIRFHITLLHRHLLNAVLNMAIGKKKGCSRSKVRPFSYCFFLLDRQSF